MQKYAHSLNNTPLSRALYSLFLLIIFVLGGLAVGNFVGLLFALPFSPLGLEQTLQAFSAPHLHPELKLSLMIIQAFTALIAFVAAPWLFVKFVEKQEVQLVEVESISLLLPFIYLAAATVCFIIFNSAIIEWNMQVKFPEWLSDFEVWARAMEDQLAEVTKMLTKMDNLGEFALAFVVIAIIPAIGEEFVFRGVFQNLWQRITGNAHVAIWISAVVFGLIHMQFYGAVPRILLGALFGYLYIFSGKNLLYPILGHLLNNGMAVTAVYMSQRGMVDYDLENQSAAPWYLVALGGVATVGFLFLFKQLFESKRNDEKLEESI